MTLASALVLGMPSVAYVDDSGRRVSLDSCASLCGVDAADLAAAIPALPRRLRRRVTLVAVGGRAERLVPVRWLARLARYSAQRIPAALHPILASAQAHHPRLPQEPRP